MTFSIRTANLRTLNSLTKYPSIPTYHTLGDKGRLAEPAIAFDGPVVGTEKVDGTNARIVFLPDGTYLLGSREELLYASGDLIGNPALGIVEHLRPVADALREKRLDAGGITVVFGEVYGGNVTAHSKQYTGEKRVGYRVFDVVRLTDYETPLTWSAEQLSGWRESGGQPFVTEDALMAFTREHSLETTPRILEEDGAAMPKDLEGAFAWLRSHAPATRCALDAGAGQHPEGIVVRTRDRRTIAKLRYEDYERTLRAKR
ncbi:RNA ligase family protein [Corallococcus exiguus]|uniref:RNA ligase family protein n=1 Tax=Corallococcus exiguus TaxID=83462 RepID=UPI003DA66384